MALYYEAATIISSPFSSEGSLRSRIYDSKANLKSPPALLYGLITECAKWDIILAEVIERAGIMANELRLTPPLALLLVHDHLLSKRGIACPQNHALRLATERHKARLASELTKARLRRKCPTLEALLIHTLAQKGGLATHDQKYRWIRVNALKTTLAEELRTGFSDFKEFNSQRELLSIGESSRSYAYDQNVPNLVALKLSTKEITRLAAYKSGRIILQDKASCFPAHLLLESKPQTYLGYENTANGDVVDACAAPGNKTSHIASILATRTKVQTGQTSVVPTIYACERDAKRSETLVERLKVAGATEAVRVLAKQDFLKLQAADPRFRRVTHLLLDPSCSGSGMLGRKDIPILVLPKNPRESGLHETGAPNGKTSKGRLQSATRKRKREDRRMTSSSEALSATTQASIPNPEVDRLRLLSNLQTRIIEHAFKFPNAKVVTYSTCSIHEVENEMVALRALHSEVAQKRNWRLLRRDEQPQGLQTWPHRGNDLDLDGREEIPQEIWSAMTPDERAEFKEACIRCIPAMDDGTMGFFVIGFVRNPQVVEDSSIDLNTANGSGKSRLEDEGDEWQGFSDSNKYHS